MSKAKRFLAIAACLAVSAGVLAGCGAGGGESVEENSTPSTVNVQDKTLKIAYASYHESGVDPHVSYAGWYTTEFGIGETLFKITDDGSLDPWLAESYENVDETTWKIKIKDGIKFHNGKPVDAAAVKACYERLLSVHDRAPTDLNIASMEADGQVLTIKTKAQNPILINCLSEPYCCVIDVSEEVNGNDSVIGTGPYKLVWADEDSIDVEANPDYWDGTAKIGKISMVKISDGDTAAMAMQNKEVDVVQGVPYSTLEMFQNNSDFIIEQVDTSRSYSIFYNMDKPELQDANVRKAIASALNKEEFTSVLLYGNGSPAEGLFPASYAASKGVKDVDYDLDAAKALLAQAGWTDTDGSGYVDKNGADMELDWVTYTSRQELPILAEMMQASLKQIGIKINIITADNVANYTDSGNYDILGYSMVTAPTGDPEYVFSTFLAKDGACNYSNWQGNKEYDALLEQLRTETDPDERTELAIKMQKILLEENVVTVASHLKMSYVTKNTVSNCTPSATEYYMLTADTDIQ